MRPDSSKWQWSVQVIDDPKTVNAWCMVGRRMALHCQAAGARPTYPVRMGPAGV
jgi:hypothetical protein